MNRQLKLNQISPYPASGFHQLLGLLQRTLVSGRHRFVWGVGDACLKSFVTLWTPVPPASVEFVHDLFTANVVSIESVNLKSEHSALI